MNSSQLSDSSIATITPSSNLRFGRIHSSLRVTPAMEAGVTDHIWSAEEIVALAPIEAPAKRGPYKKRAETISE